MLVLALGGRSKSGDHVLLDYLGRVRWSQRISAVSAVSAAVSCRRIQASSFQKRHVADIMGEGRQIWW